MTTDQFLLTIDRKLRWVSLKSTGFWTDQTIDLWVQSFDRLLAEMPSQDDRLRLTVDLRDHSIQSKDVATKIQERVANYVHLFERVAVILSPSAVAGLQARRVTAAVDKYGRQRFFDSSEIDVAAAWVQGADASARQNSKDIPTTG